MSDIEDLAAAIRGSLGREDLLKLSDLISDRNGSSGVEELNRAIRAQYDSTIIRGTHAEPKAGDDG